MKKMLSLLAVLLLGLGTLSLPLTANAEEPPTKASAPVYSTESGITLQPNTNSRASTRVGTLKIWVSNFKLERNH
ncbi:hypothetical protein [Listeria valentina]|uniref:hypothetical protein n=1 Tax=Listeria valentina TaxID=2705293 RepID=UPI001431C92E|nr:hypothetical protein [Listeria valentina]